MMMKRVWMPAFLMAASCRPAPVQEVSDVKKMSAPANEAAAPTEQEMRDKLSPEQFQVCRLRGTEAPGSGKYLHHKADGIYACAACGQHLFDSKTKYDACGWPSYWDAIPGAVKKGRPDDALEAICTKCGSHLGHIFDDGPPPTGLRY